MCARILFSPHEEGGVNISQGVLISEKINDIDQFKENLKTIVYERGVQSLTNSVFSVSGVGITEEKAVKSKYEQALKDLDLEKTGAKIDVYSIPKATAKARVTRAFQMIMQRFVFFFPSIKRDYEGPTTKEIISGFVTDVIVETGNVVLLFHNPQLTPLDRELTIGTHLTLLLAYGVFSKFLGNWITRTKSNKEIFLREALSIFPFVANYSILGNFSKILAFMQTHTSAQTWAQFGHQMYNFTGIQGFNLFIETLFYTLVISKGITEWVNTRDGLEDYDTARAVGNWNQVPFTLPDAILLSAAATAAPFYRWGPLSLNWGQLGIMGLTAVGTTLVYKPNLLDPTIRWYQKYDAFKKEMFERVRKLARP